MTAPQQAAQRNHFEELCFLRTLYRMRGSYDSVGCISMYGVMQAAEIALGAPAAPKRTPARSASTR